MANEKNINSRIQHKYDTEANWEKATGFIPKAGELIIYSADNNYNYARVKIGNGVTTVNELPFITDSVDEHIDNTDIHITENERTYWNSKSNFGGSWEDLSNKPFGEITDWNTFLILRDTSVVNFQGNKTILANVSSNLRFTTGATYRIYLMSDGAMMYDTTCTAYSPFLLNNFKNNYYTSCKIENSGIFITLNPNIVSTTYDVFIQEERTNISTLDDKFISNNIARVDNIPTSVSELENDAGYITANDIEIVSDVEFLNWLNEAKVVEPVSSASGELYVTNNNKIYVL